jgi:hypothetical protein
MDTKVFYEVIVPLLEVEATALICISTPQDDMNFYSAMFDMHLPDGSPLFVTLEVSLVCDACKESDHPERCPHMTDEIPPWKSIAKFDMVKQIYGDQIDLLQRESMGVITQDLQSVFKQKYVDRMFAMDQYELQKTPLFVFVACDPNGGGSSQMGLVSIIIEFNKIIVVGLDSVTTKGHEQIQTLLTAHIDGLREQEKLKDAWFIFIPESNLGHESDHMRYMLRNYRKVWTITEKSRTGVITTATRKELYTMETQKYICQESLQLWKDLVVSNPMGVGDTKARVMSDFKKQILAFKRIIQQPQRGFALPRVVYTGKFKGGNDDLCICLTMAVYWGIEFITHRVKDAPYEMFA